MFGQRQLDQQGVHVRVRAYGPDHRLELCLGDVAGKLLVYGLDADLGAVLVFHRHIAGTRAVVTDEDRPEAGCDPDGLEVSDTLGQLGPFLGCECLSV